MYGVEKSNSAHILALSSISVPSQHYKISAGSAFEKV